MKRPRPTQRLISEECGYNQGLISSFHHGMYETHLEGFYPFLDFNELVAFAASSWKSREKEYEDFSRFVEPREIYDIFQHVFKIGIPWLRKNTGISDESVDLYQRLNPFRGENLRDRLNADVSAAEQLKDELLRKTNKYIFECQLDEEKSLRDESRDQNRLVVMTFQNFYPKKGKIVPAYAAEIGRILNGYSHEYESRQLVLF